MNDKKTITVEIPVLDNVDQMKVVETFTEEQLWYVCAIAKAFEKKQSNWNSLRDFIEKFNFVGEFGTNRTYIPSDVVLDKMNELEGEDNNGK